MNLLLEQDKQDIKKGLKNRFVIVLLGAVSAAFVIGFGTLLPAYFISNAKLSNDSIQNNVGKIDEINPSDKSLEIPNEISTKLDTINTNINSKNISTYIKDIITLLPSNISINSIVFLDNQSLNSIKGLQINISGIASDRETLLLLVRSLKESSNFSSVFVPVSDFTKNKDVTFNINLFVNQK